MEDVKAKYEDLQFKTAKMGYLVASLNYARTTNNLTLERDIQAVIEKEIREVAPVGTASKTIELRQG